jgi:hypothetical protein
LALLRTRRAAAPFAGWAAAQGSARVDVADCNEYERFQKMTKLPGVHRIIYHPMMKLIKSID